MSKVHVIRNTTYRPSISPVATVIASHNVSFPQFADDTQLYIGLNPRTPEDLLGALNQCSTDVLSWFTNNGLSLNPTKNAIVREFGEF